MDPNTQALMMGAAGTGGAAAIEFIASAQQQNSNSLYLSISKPTGTQQGDLMIAICAAAANKTWTGPTGWTEVIDQGTAPSIRVAYKVAGASESSSYDFTLNTAGNASGVIATYRNASYDTVGTISTTVSGSVQTAPAITLSSSSSAILAFFAGDQNSRTWSNPTSGLVSTASDSDSTNPSWALYRELNLSSGSTGTRSATVSSISANNGCILVGIKPV